MKQDAGRFYVYENPISKAESRKCIRWKNGLANKFDYDPDEIYELSVVENEYLGSIFGLKEIVRGDKGKQFVPDHAVVCSTVRMGFGHYRIAMAAVSCARALGFTPYWLDLLSIPGITQDVIGWCNKWYSRFSRLSQRSKWFDRHVWESVTTGNPTLPILNGFLNSWIVGWPWRFLKTNVKDYKMSELLSNLHRALPSDVPVVTSHMWNAMGAVAGGMTNVVDMMFDNWPMAFQLTAGAKHAVQSPSGYYGFRALRGFTPDGTILKSMPEDAIFYTGHHVDHELVKNIEFDCQARLARMQNNEPRRFLLTMGGAGAERALFKAVIEHMTPMIRRGEAALFINMGDHADNWDWLQSELTEQQDMLQTHFNWDNTKALADNIRSSPAEGLHVFLFDNIFHAVYATNYMMRVVDVMLTKPSELAFYPVPKIFNKRVGGHEKWGAIRSAEIGDGTIESRDIPDTLQAIDLMIEAQDLMELYCSSIIKNKSIGIYDGAYNSVALATGIKFDHDEFFDEEV